jgi:hypothetical protein
MIKQYKKNPVVIEAIQLTSDNFAEVEAFIGYTDNTRRHYSNEQEFLRQENPVGIYVKTLEGTMLASIGDYVIKGVKGEFYPCKPDIFSYTYEEA